MVKESNVELAQTMDQLLIAFVNALSEASLAIDKKFEEDRYSKLPVKYAIPKMSIDMRLTLGVEKGGVIKGFFKNRSTSNSQELVSSIKMEIVAVPKLEKNNKP